MPGFPVDEELDIIDGVTQYKTGDWWKAVVLYEGYGRREIAVYLWMQKEGEWRRKQKYKIGTPDEWERDKQAIESLVGKLPEEETEE